MSSSKSDTSTMEMEIDNSSENISQQQSVGIEEYTPGGTRFWIPDVECKPIEGIEFESLDKAWDFYRDYAKKGGFDVKKGGQYDPLKGSPLTKYFLCSREGYKPVNNNDNEIQNGEQHDESNGEPNRETYCEPKSIRKEPKKKQKRKRSSIRCGCEAHILLKKIPGNRYQVKSFGEKHNHSLVHESDVQFLRACRQLTYHQKNFLHSLSHANLGPVRGFKIMKEIYGGFENVGATVNECKNFKRDLNRYIGDRDAQMVVEKLISRKDFNPNFSVDYITDEKKILRGLFWADEESKHNYSLFGDVLSFDATFRSNKYKMVFVPFTGIDNHNRSVTFGAALLSKETIESYKWLLESFMRAFGQEPQIVVTDQDPAMQQAIEMVFTSSRHRLCMWHIMQKLSTKVGPTLSHDDTFKRRICDIVWTDKIEPDVFEMEWMSMIADFGLEENKWLGDMFNMRFRWIPAYYRDEPFSGLMRTTSRSESENHFFGQLTNTNLTLVEFLSHFETTMDSQRYTRSKNDHETRYTIPDLKTTLPIEEEAAQIFTRTIFYDVQDEINHAMMHCHSFNVTDEGGIKICEIQDSLDDLYNRDCSHPNMYKVLFRQSSLTVSCSCKRYESYGLLCRHIFLVFKMFNVRSFPKKYIMQRWTKEALPAKPNDQSSNSNQVPNQPINEVVRDINLSNEYCVNRLAGDMEKLTLYRDHLKELMKKADADVPNPPAVNKNAMFCSMLGVTEPDEVNIHPPLDIRNKGCGNHKRLKSKKEIAMEEAEAANKFRTCGKCGKREGHNAKTCGKRQSKNAKAWKP